MTTISDIQDASSPSSEPPDSSLGSHDEAFVRPVEHEPSKAWMISFADVLSLMLTFFILLFAMSEVRMKEWHELTTSLNDELNPGRIIMRFEEEQPHAQPLVQVTEGLNLSYTYNILQEQLSKADLQLVDLRQEEQHIILSLRSGSLFQAGSADFSEQGVPLVRLISNAVSTLPNAVAVHGHTDPRPMQSERFASNWELSLARADAVARLIRAAGYAKDIEVLGMADGRYTQDHTDQAVKRRMELARRVDVIIRKAE